jgi:hypothetical protein
MALPQISIDLIEASNVLGPLALVIVSIAVYGIFVFHFYRFLARKDIFRLDLQKHNQAKRPFLRKTISVVFYVIKFLLLYPIFVFVWFAVIAGLLYMMSRNQSTDNIMLAAMGVVGAIRMCSYYNGALSTDIAKILPFALLGIMLIDNTLIDITNPTEGVREAALQLETVLYYLVAVVALEFVLRVLSGIVGWIKGKRDKSSESEEALAEVDDRDWRAEYAQKEAFESSVDATAARVRPAREQLFMGQEREEESMSPTLGATESEVEPQTAEVQEVMEWVRKRAAYSSPKPISPVPLRQPFKDGDETDRPTNGAPKDGGAKQPFWE